MKIGCRIFILIGMVLGLFLVFPFVVGIIALIKLEQVKDKNELFHIGIITLLFCSLFGGILLLLISNEQLGISRSNKNSEEYECLMSIKKLYECNIIDEKTYEEKKKKYIAIF